MAARIFSIAAARAKRAGRGAPSEMFSGTMSAKVAARRIEIQFSEQLTSFELSPAQARFWAHAFLTLADAAEGK